MLSKLLTKVKPLFGILTSKRCRHAKVLKFYERKSRIRQNKKLFPIATYGGSNIVTLIHSSNRGSIESSEYIKEILRVLNAPVIFEAINPQPPFECNDDDHVDNKYKLNEMDKLILSFQRNRNALCLDYRILNYEAQHERIRMSGTLRLFVAVMKFFPFPGYETRNIDYDITLVGGNVKSELSELEYEPINGMVETLRICTERSTQRLIEYAYQYAIQNRHHHITFVHKFDQFELSDGILMRVVKEMHKKYPSINIEDLPANEVALDLVINPRRFDVICCSERYTNAIASIICGISGGVDLFCTSSFGRHHALFQPLQTRLSLPIDDDGKDMSPYGVIFSCVQLLLHMGLCEIGVAIWEALIKTMIVDKMRTQKYGGKSTAADVYCNVINYLQKTHAFSN